MIDPLSAIFKEGLFQTKKSPDRDWMVIAERAGGRIYGVVCEEFAHPEIALCALIHSMGEVILCQPDQSKREKLLKALPSAISACIESLEKMESDEPYEFEGDGEGDDDAGPVGRPGEPEQEEEVDPEEEIDLEASGPAAAPMNGSPEQVSPPEEEEDGDLGDENPWGKPQENPAKLAGYKRKRKGGRES